MSWMMEELEFIRVYLYSSHSAACGSTTVHIGNVIVYDRYH